MAIFEGVCERVFGCTFALHSYPEYLDFSCRCAVPWDLPGVPFWPGQHSLWPRQFALALAGCPLLPVTFSSLRPCAPVAERPADGLPRWQLPALHFQRRSRRWKPRRRGSRAESQPVIPARFGAVLVGAARGLPLPVPVLAPLLVRLGVLACEEVFPRPVVGFRVGRGAPRRRAGPSASRLGPKGVPQRLGASAPRVCSAAKRCRRGGAWAGNMWISGLAGSLGRSGRGAAKSSDPVGVAGRQKFLWLLI